MLALEGMAAAGHREAAAERTTRLNSFWKGPRFISPTER
jgi:hypothetical protein